MEARAGVAPIDDVVAGWLADPERADCIVHIEDLPGRDAIYADESFALPDAVGAAVRSQGIERLYRHQAQVIARLREGRHTVVVAGTAAGKSLCYQVPIAEAALADPTTRALAIYPTKALAQDQLRSFHRLGIPEVVPATYDGDTPTDQRQWVRAGTSVVLTNPDMLHVGILPNHARWADFFHRLRFVVVDELHMLRGIFGSHVAHVLRRLARVAAHYGASPTFAFTSATIGNPGELAEALLGRPVQVVAEDASPAGAKRFVLWNPPLEDENKGTRASSLRETTALFADLVRADVRTIAFSRSRKATELIYRWARERLDDDRAERIAAYRGGYTVADRRRIEDALFSGDLAGVAATNALELGIDVSGLDAAVINTFPGTISSLRQQAGRAGRALDDSLAVLVAGQDALDQYYMNHPGDLFSRSPEAAVVNPDNPKVLAAHLRCAAHELPMVVGDRRYFGEGIEEAATDLVATGHLRLREGKLYSMGPAPARTVNIRSSGGAPYTLIDQSSGELLGTADEGRAFSQAHPGAVYLHQGDSYLVEDLNRATREIAVRKGEVGYYTQPKEDKYLTFRSVDESGSVGRLGRFLGTVEVESTVVGYRRKSIRTGEVLGTEPLDLPPLRLVTQAFWITIPDELYAEADIGWSDVPGTLHAAEHTAIAMLPLFAICDRWDVGGLSTAVHEQTGGGAFFIYDGYDGGAGIAPIGYHEADRLLRATLEAVRRCPCASGCPSCVQSPKCGNFNDPLDKAGAARLLGAALG